MVCRKHFEVLVRLIDAVADSDEQDSAINVAGSQITAVLI